MQYYYEVYASPQLGDLDSEQSRGQPLVLLRSGLCCGQKNKSLATTPGDENFFPHTPETLSGTASKDSITKNSEKTTQNLREFEIK